jgi:hypothetical protein
VRIGNHSVEYQASTHEKHRREKKKPGHVTPPGFVRSLKVLVQRVLAGLAVLHDQMNLVIVEYELVIFLNRLNRCGEKHNHNGASHQPGNQKHRLGEFSLDVHFLFSLWAGHANLETHMYSLLVHNAVPVGLIT